MKTLTAYRKCILYSHIQVIEGDFCLHSAGIHIIIFEPYSHEVKYAIEVKSCEEVQNRHLKGLRAFREEHPQCHSICISHDKSPRITDDGIEIWPAEGFLSEFWNGRFF